MPEEVLFEHEQRLSRAEVADYLRTVADRLGEDGTVTLEAGERRQELAVPERPTFEVKVERETSSSGGPAELSVEFELEWVEGGADGEGGDASLSIG
jgi:amphi-Trp domain-containing protein